MTIIVLVTVTQTPASEDDSCWVVVKDVPVGELVMSGAVLDGVDKVLEDDSADNSKILVDYIILVRFQNTINPNSRIFRIYNTFGCDGVQQLPA